ncbi:uncharacterized protein LOC105420403 isoform X2 [Amborella trichopoda]|uniref:uncharacterized protein LOC105420403 isoform X2 n=1 Tax=Amborella trichopoda TaxID=13333 RepID=UPI0009C0F5D0|nr:uncharacterized protein LOC105420403 isoform X2 [Amborella trichopoda]|eukprot:XP_020520998.1 uncharacterized protein LOC105420403 isoform X2 [Amborella trichopoda]
MAATLSPPVSYSSQLLSHFSLYAILLVSLNYSLSVLPSAFSLYAQPLPILLLSLRSAITHSATLFTPVNDSLSLYGIYDRNGQRLWIAVLLLQVEKMCPRCHCRSKRYATRCNKVLQKILFYGNYSRVIFCF